MLKLDLKNAITKNAIEKYNKQVAKIATKMERLETPGYKFLGWKDLPMQYDKAEFEAIKRKAKRLHKDHVDLLVVIGIGGSFAGAKAGIEMVLGEYPTSSIMEIMFVGESLSATNLAQKLNYARDRNFAINVISKSGTTTEPAIAFRLFRKLLEEKVGVNNAANFIVATTDANRGALLEIAKSQQYETFIIPDNIGGRFSVLTAVGLFPMACAGLDIDAIMKGALAGHKQFAKQELKANPAYQYAVARFILTAKYPVELLVQYEPQMRAFNEWWKQLAGETEGKNNKGVFPASAIFSTDLHSLGQFIQEGSKVLFETVLTIENPVLDVTMIENTKNLDNLNYLLSKTMHDVNMAAFSATTDAHVKVGKVPNIHIEIEKLDEYHFGELVIFFEYAIAMTAYLQGVNPFNQPGVEVYKNNMFKQLGKPERY